jgi:hypothetical protein
MCCPPGLIQDKFTTDIRYFSLTRKFPLHILFSHFDEQKTSPCKKKENALFIVFWIYLVFRYLLLIFDDKLEIKRKKNIRMYLWNIIFIAILYTPNGDKNAENQFW